jgi:hypothetical protein
MSDQYDPAPTSDDAGDMDAMSSAGSDVEYMFAVTGSGFGMNLDGRITIKGASATTLFFSDRPPMTATSVAGVRRCGRRRGRHRAMRR